MCYRALAGLAVMFQEISLRFRETGYTGERKQDITGVNFGPMLEHARIQR